MFNVSGKNYLRIVIFFVYVEVAFVKTGFRSHGGLKFQNLLSAFEYSLLELGQGHIFRPW